MLFLKRLGLSLVFLLAVVLLTARWWSAWNPTTAAAYNIAEYRLRRWWWDQVGMPTSAGSGSLSGWVTDESNHPVADALVLVSSITGQTFSTHTDAQGHYLLTDVPAGIYRPIAAAWGYELPAHSKGDNVGPRLRIGDKLRRWDAQLTPHTAPPLVLDPAAVVLGPGLQVDSDFPAPATAIRQALTITTASAILDGDLLYTPAQGAGPWPLLVIAFPNTALNWDKATIQFAAAGYVVLAITPDPERGLDLEAHAADTRLAITYAQRGLITPAIGEPDFVLLTGSFGSLYGYRALPDLEHLHAIVDIGGVSDAFLGVQALYSETLAIPPPYDMAVASMGRPDNDPGFFLAYSPAFWAEHLPPTLIIHTYEDEVIPYNQAIRMAEALAAAGVPHELYLYHANTHYLDPRDPTPAAVAVFDRTLAFIEEGKWLDGRN